MLNQLNPERKGNPPVSSRKQGTTDAHRGGRRPRVPDWEPTRPPLTRVTYIPRDGWLEILAGENPALLRGDKPMATVISQAAGLDRTTLTRIINGQGTLTPQIVDALTRFLEVYRGYSEAEAREALFERVTTEVVSA